ncbi:2-keto-4-pentenoate hydratase [Ancylobacter sp. VNQ12]|uniref:2-keto-4-pentenoate hydratase n=1 Tax=Ancylobacter sp. VNQ12 TaxID=3400920 RepID=UPI003C0607FA
MTSAAAQFVSARSDGRALSGFPGVLPGSLEEAYAVQDEVLRLTTRRLGGWKVAMIPPAFHARYSAERLVGPVFADLVQTVTDGGAVDALIFEGGFAAVEAEFVVRVTGEPPSDPQDWLGDVGAFATLHVGSEIASSPLATINQLGPGAVISDHGNNAGAIVGPRIEPGQMRDWSTLASATRVEGVPVGEGSAARVPGGPFAAVAFLARQLAGRGRSLAKGDVVLTGMTTGVHDVLPGQTARLEFEGVGSFDIRFAAYPHRRRAAAS